MAVRLAEGLPAAAELAREGVPLFSGDRPARRVTLVNLMPEKEKTERQIARKLGLAGPDVALSLAVPARYRGKNADPGHMAAFYGGLEAAAEADGVILTGAPIELLAFEAVDYWEEIAHLLDRLRARRTPLLTLCWGAQAALYRYHGIPKHALPEKRAGFVFEMVERMDMAERRLGDGADIGLVMVEQQFEAPPGPRKVLAPGFGVARNRHRHRRLDSGGDRA